MNNSLVLDSVRNALGLLPNSFRKRAVFLLCGIVVNSFLDLVGLAAVLPLLATILKDGFIESSEVLKYLYDYFSFSSEKYFILFLSVALILFILLKNVFSLWIHKLQIAFAWDAYGVVSSDMLKSSFLRGFSFLKSKNSNEISNEIITVPNQFSMQLLLQLFMFFNELVILLFILTSLVIYDFKVLVILTGVILPVFFFFYTRNKKRVANYNTELNDNQPKISKTVFDVVFGYVDVVIGGVFNEFSTRYSELINKNKKIRVALTLVQQFPNRLIEVVVVLAIVLILLYGVFLLETPQKIVGLLSVFGLAAYRSIPSINRIMLALLNIKGVQFIFEIFDEYLPLKSVERNDLNLVFEKNIKLSGLGFKYSDSLVPLFSNFSLKINKGETVGLVGKSGSGKTTIMNIMLGFLKATSGKFEVDDVLLDQSNLVSWQKKLGYVSQDVFLMDGTIKENIAFGSNLTEIRNTDIEKVIEKSQLKSFLDSLPHGLETLVGERGAKISGGQKQRIGIARALYHGAEVLFFDEATSALDSETEAEVTESIKTLNDGKLTMVIIAHRRESLKYCDRIIDMTQNELENI